MNKETLEEVAERIGNNFEDSTFKAGVIYGVIEGAKWQQERSYSDDEVKKIAFDFYYDMSHKMNVPENLISENMTNVDVWFETFKNKK